MIQLHPVMKVYYFIPVSFCMQHQQCNSSTLVLITSDMVPTWTDPNGEENQQLHQALPLEALKHPFRPKYRANVLKPRITLYRTLWLYNSRWYFVLTTGFYRCAKSFHLCTRTSVGDYSRLLAHGVGATQLHHCHAYWIGGEQYGGLCMSDPVVLPFAALQQYTAVVLLYVSGNPFMFLVTM